MAVYLEKCSICGDSTRELILTNTYDLIMEQERSGDDKDLQELVSAAHLICSVRNSRIQFS